MAVLMHVLMRVLPAYLLTRESKKCDRKDILTSTSSVHGP